MRKSKKEPIPEHFETAESTGEFWDTHDLADYLDETRETDLAFNLQRKHYYIRGRLVPEISNPIFWNVKRNNNNPLIRFKQCPDKLPCVEVPEVFNSLSNPDHPDGDIELFRDPLEKIDLFKYF